MWFGEFPAVMRIRVTNSESTGGAPQTRSRSSQTYNFAPFANLLQSAAGCTLVGSFSKHPKDWLTREYTEIHTGATIHLGEEYEGRRLLPQTLSGVLWPHYLHPEDKSLAPDGKPFGPYTSGLLLRRPIQAMIPLITIGKENPYRHPEEADKRSGKTGAQVVNGSMSANRDVATATADFSPELKFECFTSLDRLKKRR